MLKITQHSADWVGMGEAAVVASTTHSTRSASAIARCARRSPSCSTGSTVSRDAGGVAQDHGKSRQVERDLDDVARRAGVRRHDCDLPSRHTIEQSGLANVGRPRDRYHKPFTQPLATLPACEPPDLLREAH